ncbi:MAG: nitrous oxide reductase accessory protein NosL [Haloarculaceae archaeon]
MTDGNHRRHHLHRCDECCPDRAIAGVPRRRVLAGVAAGTAALAGCSSGSDGGGGGDRPDPVTLTTDDQCEVCGMVIPNHPGPSTEIFYADHTPTGHPNPAHFDSTWEAFQYDFRRGDQGWQRSVMYVTDYSAVDYRIRTDQGDRLISRHPKASAFVAADDVTFVAGSAVKGAMGKDLIGFGERGDARSFADEHGGQLVGLGDVSRELIAQLGT